MELWRRSEPLCEAGEYEAELGRMAESLMEDVKEPEWLLMSEPTLADLSRSLTRLKCPVSRAHMEVFNSVANMMGT